MNHCCSFFPLFELLSSDFFSKFDLETSYPPPYLREVWHFKEAQTVLIRRALKKFNWETAF